MKGQGISGWEVKCLAMASMTLDHIGAVLLKNVWELRAVGRLAFVLYAFLLAEGMMKTGSRSRYCLRLLLFALLSEPCFDFAQTGRWVNLGAQNVFWTLLLGVLAVWCSGSPNGLWWAALALCGLAATLLDSDYGAMGVLLIWAMAAFRGSWKHQAAAAVLFCAAVSLISAPVQMFGAAAILPMALYNGERGGKRLPRWCTRWAPYAYYPLHLLLIALCRA